MPKESKPTNADPRQPTNGRTGCSGRHRPRRRRLVWMRCWKWCLLVSVYMTLFACCECSSSEMRSQQRHHHHKNQHRTEVTDGELVNESSSQLEKPFGADEEHDKRASCPNCVLSEKNSYRPDKHSSDALRLEAIKYQILSKLGLKSKPNVTSPVPREVILETLGRAEGTNLAGLGLTDSEREGDEGETVSPSTRPLESEPDDYFGRTSEIITFAEPGHTLNGQPLLEFAHSHEDTGGSGSGSELRVKGASLWVRIDFRASVSLDRREQINPRNLTLWVFRILHTNTTQLSGKEFDEHTEMAASLPVNLSKSNLGWKKFDLTATVREWYASSGSSPRQRLRLLVDCSGCSDLVEAALFRQPGGPGSGRSLGTDPERPYLVIHTDPTQTKRVRRRALDCSGALRGQCCKQRFYVNFKQLGWEDWIIAPGGYYANYCRGDCGGIHRTPDTFLNYYTHVMEEFRKMDRLSGMQPCCAPLKFSSMSLIYFGPDSNIIKRDLPKMVVDECGCP